MTFLEKDGHDKLDFKPDQNGRMQMILPYPVFVGQRVGLIDNNKILLPVPVIEISLLIMLLTIVLWPVAWFVRRHYDSKPEMTPIERRLRRAGRVVLVLELFFIAAITDLVAYRSMPVEFLSDRGITWFHLPKVRGVLGARGTHVVHYNAIQSWRHRTKRIWGKLQASLFVLVCFGFMWFMVRLCGKFVPLWLELLRPRIAV